MALPPFEGVVQDRVIEVVPPVTLVRTGAAGAVGCGGGGGWDPPTACAARFALTSGSGIPSGSSGHPPWLEHPAVASASAHWPFGHSPLAIRAVRAWVGVMPGFAAAISATTPATCGVAILVLSI